VDVDLYPCSFFPHSKRYSQEDPENGWLSTMLGNGQIPTLVAVKVLPEKAIARIAKSTSWFEARKEYRECRSVHSEDQPSIALKGS